ncbi:DUF2206 domain-containing protein [Halorubrum sp. AS12]|uniref:DUF2206 domain-containing protein n=1 Tax=Halorubrum sp. AS12 TaxID=3409687 RepID=UPI003DA7A4D7
MLAGSALPSGTGFSVARVMMIVFTFSAPFALFGIDGIQSAISFIMEQLSVPNLVSRTEAVQVFAVILCIFLLMNSGVTAELVQRDYSPSQKISNERLLNSDVPSERAQATQCLPCDVNTHVWLYKHASGSIQAYGDEYIESQTDFYSAAITERVGFTPGPNYYKSIWTARNGTNETAYLVLLPRNIDTNGVYETKYRWHSMDKLEPIYQNSSVIYHSNETNIYITYGD